MNNKIVFVLGLTPQGLSVIRTLARAGHRVLAFGTSKRQVGYHSRYGEKYIFYSVEELKQMVNMHLKTLSEKPLCYITSGEILALVLENYPELYDICEVISSPYHIVRRLAHKDQMYQIAEQKGFVVAPYRTLDKLQSPEELKYPVFLKRNYEIPLFFKAERIDSAAILTSYMQRIPKGDYKHILVQDYITIDKKDLVEISAQGFYSCGILKGILVGHQKRKLKIGLTSCLVELNDVVLVDNITRLCKSFMKDLVYTGFAEFEFMYDQKDAVLYFVEVNTRTCGSHSALTYKYLDISQAILSPYDCVDLVTRNRRVIWISLLRDIRVRLEQKNFSGLLDIFKSSYDIFSWDDPMPFFRQII